MLQGEYSDWLPVTSRVPQGSILGPLLFIVYANDMPVCISGESKLALFADDSKLFGPMTSGNSSAVLQPDLNSLYRWSVDSKMSFNTSKCLVLNMSKKWSPTYTNTEYYVGGQCLQVANTTKGLSVTVSSNLSWTTHISYVCKSQQNSWPYQATCKLLYITLVWPQLEYASNLWSPYTAKECVQRRATKFVLNYYGRDLSYKDRCC